MTGGMKRRARGSAERAVICLVYEWWFLPFAWEVQLVGSPLFTPIRSLLLRPLAPPL